MKTSKIPPQKTYRVRLHNVQTHGAMCGYGEGDTHEEAIAEAMRLAKSRDENATYNPATNEVDFRGGINC